jgi:uncharacterized RDD family membrane protein YckC
MALSEGGFSMTTDNAPARDFYAIAAEAQRTPGFGFCTDIQPVYQPTLQAASILSRFLAALVDGILTSFIALFVVIGLVFTDRATGGDITESARHSPSVGKLLIVIGATLAVYWIYYVLQETSGAQATLGKRLVGIKVATRTGSAIGIGQATVRFIVKFGPSIYPLLGIASLVGNVVCLIASSPSKRALHDLIAGTVVIEA